MKALTRSIQLTAMTAVIGLVPLPSPAQTFADPARIPLVETTPPSSEKIVVAEYFSGGSGADVYQGTTAADTAKGNSGTDTLRGSDANDILEGGSDNDSFDGGNGTTDKCTGNSGQDTDMPGVAVCESRFSY